MNSKISIDSFLSQYSEEVFTNANKLRDLLHSLLPDIIEQLDLPAKIIGYCYGQRYIDLICVIIPSKKGLKLGFNNSIELHDPKGLLEGNGKVSRYVVINSEKDINSPALKNLIKEGLKAYKQRILNKS